MCYLVRNPSNLALALIKLYLFRLILSYQALHITIFQSIFNQNILRHNAYLILSLDRDHSTLQCKLNIY